MSFRTKGVGTGGSVTVGPPDVWTESPVSFGVTEVVLGSDVDSNPTFSVVDSLGSKSGPEAFRGFPLTELSSDPSGTYVVFSGDPPVSNSTSLLLDGYAVAPVSDAAVAAYSPASNSYTLFWTSFPLALAANSTVLLTAMEA